MPRAENDRPDTPPSIGLYAHLPFCTSKCGYCDFYSIPVVEQWVDGLVWALREELSRRSPARPIETIYVGGGTPTVLPAEALDAVLGALRAAAGRVGECTVEANPASADELKFDLLLRHGVNRLSLGAQSFRADELALLERRHGPRDAADTVAAARTAGFTNLNLDLMFAVPGQTLAGWRDTLRRAVDLAPEHLSCYCLTYEPGTRLTRLRDEGRIRPCDEESEAEMFEAAIDLLTAAGYEHYEISNFARPGRRCQANMIYWENCEYLGIGPSAVSYLDGVRSRNVADVRRYIDLMRTDPAAVVVEQERLDDLGRACETAIQMLRLTDGIDVEKFHRMTRYEPHRLFARQIREFGELGLLALDIGCQGLAAAPRSIRLTRRGMVVANRIMAEMLPDAPAEAAAT